MKLLDRDNIIYILSETLNYLEKTNLVNDNKIDEHIKTIYTIRDILKKELSNYDYENFEVSINKIISMYLQLKNGNLKVKVLINSIRNLKVDVKNIKDIQYSVLFVVYNGSMWDCFDSVWRAAKKDDNCSVYVLPIPYYTKNAKGEFIKQFYHATQLPKDVEYLDYKNINISSLDFDLIFVHNIFDESNLITMVQPEYFISELKKISKKIVYIPYHIDVVYHNTKEDVSSSYNMFINSKVDYTVTNSTDSVKLLKSVGLQSERFFGTGTPKFDYVKKVMKQDNNLDNWNKLKKFNKIFLINTSIYTLLHSGELYLDYLEKVIKYIVENNCAFIWRPHPLLLDTIVSMRPNLLDKFNHIVELATKMDNSIIDTDLDYKYSFSYADALISDNSSLFFLFVATNKPTFLVNAYYGLPLKYQNPKIITEITGLKRENYFNDTKDFIINIKNGVDKLYNERIDSFEKSFSNTDGKAGETIYNLFVSKILSD